MTTLEQASTPNPNGFREIDVQRLAASRGTTRLIGGSIEQRIGQTATMSGTNLHGWNDDLSFNRCLLQYPPPYFPTTGRWSRSQYYEVNPIGFSPSNWFAGR